MFDGLFWSCACLLFWASVFNFNSVNFFSPSELAAPLASRLGGGYAAAPAQLAGWSVRRAADRTSMLVSTARGADAASAGRRRRRQSPGACAVRGPPKPQCAVVGSRLADTLLALPDGDSWALRFGALPIGRAGPGAAGAAHSVGGHPHGWLLPASPLLRVLAAEWLGLSLTRYCWKCCPAGRSKTACQRSAGQSDCWKSCCSWRPVSIGAWCVSCWTCWSNWWTAEVRLRSTFPDRQAVQLLTGDRQLHAPRAAGRSLGWTTQLLDRRLASTAMALPCASCRTLVQRRRPWPSRWSPWNGKTVCAGWRARHACQPTAGRRDPQLKRAALRPAADEADRLPADRWALGRLPDGRRVRELRWAVRPPTGRRALYCDAPPLLLLLTDTNLMVRQTAANYWSDMARLPTTRHQAICRWFSRWCFSCSGGGLPELLDLPGPETASPQPRLRLQDVGCHRGLPPSPTQSADRRRRCRQAAERVGRTESVLRQLLCVTYN